MRSEWTYNKGQVEGWANSFKRATGVTKANASSDDDFLVGAIGNTDDATHCGGSTIGSYVMMGSFTQGPTPPADNLCDTLSMDASKQAKGDKTFTI